MNKNTNYENLLLDLIGHLDQVFNPQDSEKNFEFLPREEQIRKSAQFSVLAEISKFISENT